MGLHSANCLLRSVDFADVEQLQRTGRWDQAGELLAGMARTLLAAGAELLVLCTNTMHKLADHITEAVEIPLVYIAGPTAEAVRTAGMTTVGLLAAADTMEQDFHVGRQRDRHHLQVLVPDQANRRLVHAVISQQLCVGIVEERWGQAYQRMLRDPAGRGVRESCWLHRDRPAGRAGRRAGAGVRDHPPSPEAPVDSSPRAIRNDAAEASWPRHLAGPCQRFARKYATRDLAWLHDATLGSASHLRGCAAT